MNPKGINRKTIKRTPLQTSFIQNSSVRNSSGGSTRTSIGNSLYAVISNKPVSVEEYNKVLFQNQRLAKENALLKTHLKNCRQSLNNKTNEETQLRQQFGAQLSAAKTQIQRLNATLKKRDELQNSLVSDQFKTAVNLLMEDYLAIDSIKNQINGFGGRVETVRGMMSSLQSLMESEDQLNGSESIEISSERIESMRSSTSSIRLSLSSREMDAKRRMSTERMRRDFQILTELSTILEISTEQRLSSLDDMRVDFNADNDKENSITVQNENFGITSNQLEIGLETAGPSTSSSGPSVSSPILKKTAHIVSGTSKLIKTKAPKEAKPKKTKTKTKAETKAETKPKKKIEKKTKPKTNVSETKANDSVLCVYDFTEDEANKENVIPVMSTQRHSKRIRSKMFSLSS